MEYDPSQYRERNNASWDRIRHENASSVRSEPADPTSYYQFNTFAPPNYVAEVEENRREEEEEVEEIENPVENGGENQQNEENPPENSEDDEEIDRPDIYCMECDVRLDEPNDHDVIACSRQKNSNYECEKCQKSFNLEENLKIHRIVEHLKAIDFRRGTTCLFCPAVFNRYSAYVGHVKIHVKPDGFTCGKCGEEFASERDFQRHARRNHTDDLYELIFCPKCQKVITFEESAAHLLLHSANEKSKKSTKKRKSAVRDRKFECETCKKSFVRPAELKRHVAIHQRAEASTSVPKWKCAICQKEYSHSAGLLEHKKVAHGGGRRAVCRVCGAFFTKKSNLARHMAQIHPLDVDSAGNSKKFECADCPTVHNTLGALTRHKRTCHLQTNNKLAKLIPAHERHVCKMCRREFRDEQMLTKHKRTHLAAEIYWRNGQSAERKCDFCEKSFVLRASLLWHVQRHFVDETPRVTVGYCRQCDLQFYSNPEYRQHLEEHTKFPSVQTTNRRTANVAGNRILICRLCRPPQRLTGHRQIQEHRARHHLPRKSHLCWTCHKSFRTAQLLSLHAEVHDRQPVQCTQCPQIFHSRVALKQHTRVCHVAHTDEQFQCVVHDVDRAHAMSVQSFAEYGIHTTHEPANRAQSVTDWLGMDEESTVVQYARDTVPEDQPVRCQVCHHLYNSLQLLCEHWHGSETDTDHSYAFVTCPVCELQIRGAPDAAVHIRTAHLSVRPRLFSFMKPVENETPAPPTSAEKVHQCVQCHKVFTRKNDLDRHLTIHTGEKSYQCPQCSASFRMKSTLTSHMATHSDLREQFGCTVCHGRFFEKKSLLVHMRIHTGEQPFKCRFCDAHFRTAAMTRTHEKRCQFGRPMLADSTGAISSYQPQFVAQEDELNRTITQISSLPRQNLQLSQNSAFDSVQNTSDQRIYVITKPTTTNEYVVIVQRTKPAENSMRYALDTVSEIKVGQLQETTNLSIVLHNEQRLNLNTIKMLELLPTIRETPLKTRITVDQTFSDVFSIISHHKSTAGVSFVRRCDICEVDLASKAASDAHFYSEDHETAQLMYPSTSQQAPTTSQRPGIHNLMQANTETSEFNCKLCHRRFFDMNSLLNHIRREHDEPVVPPRPVAHTAPIN